LDNIVFPDQGGQSITILCQPEAAISKALFVCSCPKTYLKSNFDSKIFSCLYFLKSSFGIMINSFSQFKISIASDKDSTEIISIQGIIEASKLFSFGKKILLNHFSLALIVAGKTEGIFLNFQSKDNSQIKILSSIKSESKTPEFSKTPIAIGKSKLGHVFLISAGAKFTTILVIGNLFQADFIADFSLSLLS
jgi:hypothetical protein